MTHLFQLCQVSFAIPHNLSVLSPVFPVSLLSLSKELGQRAYITLVLK